MKFKRILIVSLACAFCGLAPAALVNYYTFDDAGNGGVNLLKASVGSDAFVREKPAVDVEGIGNLYALSDEAVLNAMTNRFVRSGVIAVPVNQYLVVPHGVGTEENQPHAMLFRYYIPDPNTRYHCFYKTDENNTRDGVLFSDFGSLGSRNGWGGYTTIPYSRQEWHEILVSFSGTDKTLYVDGYPAQPLVRTAAGLSVEDLSDKPYVLVSGDEDGEDGLLYLDEFRVWDTEVPSWDFDDASFDCFSSVRVSSFPAVNVYTIASEAEVTFLRDLASVTQIDFSSNGTVVTNILGPVSADSTLTIAPPAGGRTELVCLCTTGPFVAETLPLHIREESATFSAAVSLGIGAETCDFRAILQKDGEDAMLTNDFFAATSSGFEFTVSGLDPDSGYTLWLYATNSTGATLSSPIAFRTMAIAYDVEVSLDGDAIVPSVGSASLTWNLSAIGYRRSVASVTVEYGETGHSLDRSFSFPCPTELGRYVNLLTGLKPDTEYSVRITVVAADDGIALAPSSGDTPVPPAADPEGTLTASTATYTFRTAPEAVPTLAFARTGLWQSWFQGSANTFNVSSSVLDDPDKDLVPGVIMACYGWNCSGWVIEGDYVSPSGRTYNWHSAQDSKSTFAYAGYMYMEPGVSYNFVEDVDDNAEFTFNGETKIHNTTWNGISYSGVITVDEPGWYPIDVRLGDAGSGAGPSHALFKIPGGSFLYNTKGLTEINDSNAYQWMPLTNREDSILFRPDNSEPGSVTLESYSYTQTDIAADLIVSNLNFSANVYACFGAVYGGEAPADWERTDLVGTLEPGTEARLHVGSAALDSSFAYARWIVVPTVNGEDSLSVAGWTPTLYLPEAVIDTDPTPALSLSSRISSASVAKLDTTVAAMGYGAATLSLSLSFGTDLGHMSAPQTIATGVRLGQTIAHALTALSPATYFCIVTADNGLTGGTCCATNSFTMPPIPEAGTGGTVVRDGDYVIHTFSANGTLTLPTDVEADVLVLAGGGAGGYSNSGGGGGAGGLVYRRGVTLAGGSYDIVVGAGGHAVSGNPAAGNGGNSSISNATEAVVPVAIGGGGGGSRENDASYWGASGGSGGGSTQRYCHTPSGRVDGQGNIGGVPYMPGYYYGGGGGGAGAPGGTPSVDTSRPNCRYIGGAGGDGLEIDISGAFVWYAGGGGGGTYYQNNDSWRNAIGGGGGNGGGGNGGGGSGYIGSVAEARSPQPGTDGLGGGGGGGTANASANTVDGVTTGGAGGSGTVIVRYWAPVSGAVSAEPVIELRGATDNEDGSVTVSWHLVTAGSGATSCSVVASYGTDPNHLGRTVVLSEDSVVDGEGTITGLVPGRTYYISLRATNNLNVVGACGSMAKVKMAPSIEYVATKFGGDVGLLQAKFEGLPIDCDSDVLASETVRREMGPVMAFVQGNPSARTGRWSYDSEIDGVTSAWGDFTTFAYRGYIKLEKGTFYSFLVGIDDYARITIDGEVVVDQSQSAVYGSGVYECRKSGWHPIDIRLGNKIGTAGASSEFGSRGVGYVTVVPGSKNGDWWNPFKTLLATSANPILRTGPEGRGFSVGARTDSAGVYTAAIELGASSAAGSGDRLLLCYGDRLGGEDIAAWDGSVEYAGDLPDAAGTVSFAATIPDTATALRYALVDGDSNVSWSETFYRGSTGGPVILETAGNGYLNGGLTAFVRADNAAGATVELFYGPTPHGKTVLTNSVASTLDANGEGTVQAPNLTGGQLYYGYVRVTDANGLSAESDVFSAKIASGAVLSTCWIDATQYPTMRIHTPLTEVGAGAAATLSVRFRLNAYNQSWNNFPVSVTRTVSVAGDHVFEVDARDLGIGLGDSIEARVTVENGSGDQVWTSSAESNPTQVSDKRSFVWCGPASGGAWTNAANWTASAPNPDAPGYPTYGASVSFPAGDWDVVVDGENWCYQIALSNGTYANRYSFTLRAGEAGGVLHVDRPSQGNGSMYPDYSSFTMGEYNDVTFDGLAFSLDRDSSSFSFKVGDSMILKGGSEFSISDSLFMDSVSNRMVVAENSSLLLGYYFRFSSYYGEFVIDDSYVSCPGDNGGAFRFGYENNNNTSVTMGHLVFKGMNPRLEVSRFDRDHDYGKIFMDFEVPAGGFRQAPILQRGRRGGFGYAFPNTEFVCSVLPSSPALLDEGTLETTLVDWYQGLAVTPTMDPASTGCTLSKTELYGDGTQSGLVLTLTGDGTVPAAIPENAVEPVVTTYGAYTIYTFTNTAAPGVLTLEEDVEAEVLLVGGGGAGGWSYAAAGAYGNLYGGGGGGGGGVVHTNAMLLPAGSYRIDVGAGGSAHTYAFRAEGPGEAGRATTAFGLTAFGGGGGGGHDRVNGQEAPSCGGNGANGGGSYYGWSTQGVPYPGGYPGGSWASGYAGGGGGAGGEGPGQGVGGDGLEYDISGVSHCYGSGGGGGASVNLPMGSAGGRESGGHGAFAAIPSDCCPAAEPGVDGLGGGGGGGGADYVAYTRLSSYGARSGGRGGSGCVIVRVKTLDDADPKPLFELRGNEEPTISTLSFDMDYIAPGAGAETNGTSFYLAYGIPGERIDTAKPSDDPESVGVHRFSFTELTLYPGATYEATLFATNSLGVGDFRGTIVFTVPEDATDISDAAGLWQAKFQGYQTSTETLESLRSAVLSSDTRRRELGAAMFHYASYQSPIDGVVSTLGFNETFTYFGYMYLEKDKPLRFWRWYWGCRYGVWIDGTCVWDSTDGVSFHTVAPTYTGWHPIAIRMSRGTGTPSRQGGVPLGAVWTDDPTVYGDTARVYYNSGRDYVTTESWNAFMDSGDASRFRTEMPALRALSVASALRTADGVKVTLRASGSGYAMSVRALLDTVNRGTDDYTAWNSHETVATVAADASEVTLTVSDVADYRLLRFVGLMDGAPQGYGDKAWTDVVYLDHANAEPTGPAIRLDDVVTGVDCLSGSVSVFSFGAGAGSFGLNALVRKLGEDAVQTNLLCTVTETGILSFRVDGLEPATDYEFSLYAENSLGGKTLVGPMSVTTALDTYDVEVSLGEFRPEPCSVLVSWTLSAIGYQRTVASVTAEIGPADGAFDRSVALDCPTGTGTFENLVVGLLPETEYQIRITVVSTNGTTGASATGSTQVRTFRTMPEPLDEAPFACRFGLWQARLDGGRNLTDDILSAEGAEVVPGAIMSRPRNSATVTAPSGNVYKWDNNTTFGYAGYMYFEPGVEYRFVECIDDSTTFLIDGISVLADARNDPTYSNPVRFDEGGLHAVELRLGNTTGNAGNTWSDFINVGSAFLFNTDGTRVMIPDTASHWKFFENTKDSIFLFPDADAFGSVAIERYSYAGDGITAYLAVSNLAYAANVYACFSDVYGARDFGAWARTEQVGTLEPGADIHVAVGSIELDPTQVYAKWVVVPVVDGKEDFRYAAWTPIVYLPTAEIDTDPSSAITVTPHVRSAFVTELDIHVDALGYGAEGLSLTLSVGKDLEDMPEPQTIATDLPLGANFMKPLTGLSEGTYYVIVTGDNGLDGGVCCATNSFTMQPVPTAGTGGTVKRSGDYVIHTFSSSGTLTLPSNVEADILVLGGGGAGGYTYGGGGGGGGGLIYRRGVALAGGTYDITVGAGGVPTSGDPAGGNGGDSVLAQEETELARAIGGGGGGNSSTSGWGASGSSGGGNANKKCCPSGCVEGQGHIGGIAPMDRDNIGGGGGGAGGSGKQPYIDYARSVCRSVAGAGGDGLEIDISGAFTYYGGGGGGGVYYYQGEDNNALVFRGQGGNGGGGNGGGGDGGLNSEPVHLNPEPGVNGLGGGGGGGTSTATTKTYEAGVTTGQAGGSGAVIVRYWAPSSGAESTSPAIEIRNVWDNGDGSVTIAWHLTSLGAGATSCSVVAAYGQDPASLTRTVSFADASTSDGLGTITGLIPGQTYYITLRATNDRNAYGASGSKAKITLEPSLEFVATKFGGEAGLLQAKLLGQPIDYDTPILSSDTVRRELGTVMGFIRGDSVLRSDTWFYESELDGFRNEWGEVTTFAYRGYIKLEGGTVYRFATGIDEFARIAIDGETIVDQPGANGMESGIYECTRSGWHSIEVRLGNKSGMAGYASNNMKDRGVVYRTIVPGSKYEEWPTVQLKTGLEDPFLRTGPEGRGFTVGERTDEDGVYTAVISLGASASTGSSERLLLCYGDRMGGDDVAAWQGNVPYAGTLPDGAEDISFAATVPDTATALRYALVDAADHVTWSETFFRNVGPVIREVVGNGLIGGGLIANIRADNAAGATAELFFGTSPAGKSALTRSVVGTLDAAGEGVVSALNLDPGTVYYWYVRVTDAEGFSDETELRFSKIAGGTMLSKPWIDATQYPMVYVHAPIAEIGGGGSAKLTMRFMPNAYNQSWWDSAQTVETRTVTVAGDHVFEVNAAALGLSFGDGVEAQITAESAFGTETWKTSQTSGQAEISDQRSFVWCGPASGGAWTNSANWTASAELPGAPGYPIQGSYVTFPAGAWDIVVDGENWCYRMTLPDGTYANRFSLTLRAGAEGGVLHMDKPPQGNATIYPTYSGLFPGEWNDLAFEGVKVSLSRDCSDFNLKAGDAVFLRNQAELAVRSTMYMTTVSNRLAVVGGSRLYVATGFGYYSNYGELLIDDSCVDVPGSQYGTFLISYEYGQTTSEHMGHLVIKGRNPRLEVPTINRNSAGGTIWIDFEVPAGGYLQPPIRQHASNGGFNYNNPSTAVRFTVLPDSPALFDEGTIQTTLVDWYDGYAAMPMLADGSAGTLSTTDLYGNGTQSGLVLTLAGDGTRPATIPSDAVAPVVTTYGPYTIYTFTNAAETGVFTLAENVEADILLVGGGGAGGWSGPSPGQYGGGGGGGGGGGAVVYRTGVQLAAGSYRVDVGAGGRCRETAFSPAGPGESGLASSAFGFTALGGGGGGGYSSGGNADQHTARGGRGANGGGSGADGNYAQGDAYAGGSAGGPLASGVAPGGGAGDMGDSNGTGGPGVDCDIAGISHCYGSGGGAGPLYSKQTGGLGGRESGGRGASYANGSDCGIPAEPGVDGLGGGGGGGGADYLSYLRKAGCGTCPGGAGGSGCVIVRVKTLEDSDPEPLFELAGNESVTALSFSLDVDYIAPGAGAETNGTSFYLVYGRPGDEENETAALAVNPTVTGVSTFTFGSLVLCPGATYEATIIASNSLGVAASRGPIGFTVPATERDADGTAGLWQARFPSNGDVTSPILESDTLRRELGAVRFHKWGYYTSPIDGFGDVFGNNVTYGYAGYMYAEEGKTIYFARFLGPTHTYMKFDGTLLWNTWPYDSGFYTYTPTYTGWHPVEMRIGLGSGNVSRRGVFQLGMAWTEDPAVYEESVRLKAISESSVLSDDWNAFMDPGDGSRFRTTPPPQRSLEIVSAVRTVDGKGIRVGLQAYGSGETMRVYALLDAVNRGDADYTQWTSCTQVGTISANGTALYVSLPDVTDYRFLRFFGYVDTVESGYVGGTWSDIVFLDDFDEEDGSAPTIQFNSATPSYASARIEATILSTGTTAANCDVYVAFGLEPDALRNTNVVSAHATAGVVSASIHPLLPNRLYYGQVFARNEGGTSAVSPAEPFTFLTEPLDEDNGGRWQEGLWQGILPGNLNTTDDVRALAEGEGAAQRRPEVGPIAAWGLYQAGEDIPSSLHPDVPLQMQAGKTYAYTGFVWLEAGKTYYVGWDADDAAYVEIGGTDQGTVTKKKTKAGFLYTKAFTVNNGGTGWYPIELRLGNAEGEGGGRVDDGFSTVHRAHYGDPLGFAIIEADGPLSSQGLAVSSDRWLRLDGTSYGARLVTERPTREIDYASYSLSEGTLSVDFTFTAYDNRTPLYVCYGADHGGNDTNEWDHCDLVADIPMTMTSYQDFRLSVGSSVKFVRFFIDCGAAGLVWTRSIPLVEPDAPILTTPFEATDRGLGDTIWVSGGIDWAGEGDDVCNVYAEVSRAGDFTDAVSWPVGTGLGGGETFEASLFTDDKESAAYIVPGSTVSVRLRAHNLRTGKSDLTPPCEVTTLAGAGFSGDPTGKASFRTGVFSIQVDPIGATGGAFDGTLVVLYVGTNEGELLPVATNVVTEIGKQTLYYDFPDSDPIGTGYRWVIAYTNECATMAWGGRTAVYSIATIDDSVYWWKGEVAEGSWNDAENWDCSHFDALGYPQTADSTASFEHCRPGTEYVIDVPISSAAKLCLTNENVSISFYSPTFARLTPSSIEGNGFGGTNSFEAVSLETPKDQPFAIAPSGMVSIASAAFRAGGNLTVGRGAGFFLDAVTAYSARGIMLEEDAEVHLENETVWTRPDNNDEAYNGEQKPGSVFEVASRSTFTMARWVYEEGAIFIVDDATVTGNSGHFTIRGRNSESAAPGTVEIRGEAPAFNHKLVHHWSKTILGDQEWNFYVGQTTTTNSPLMSAKDFGTITAGTSKFVVNAYKDMPVYRHGFSREIKIFESTLDGKIVTENVILGATPTASSYFYYTYDHSEAREGTEATGIRLFLDSGATTMIFTH